VVPYSDKYTNALEISQTSFVTLPAVALGGPPHSGKSVLAYSLTQALRARDVPHYLLRAYPPDYEGDWFFAAEPETVRHLRFKGAQSAAWLPLLQRDIAARHRLTVGDDSQRFQQGARVFGRFFLYSLLPVIQNYYSQHFMIIYQILPGLV